MKLRERVNAAGGKAWQVDFGIVDGRRVMRSYKTRTAAEDALRDAKEARQRFGDLAPMLSTTEAADFLTARDRLRAAGASVQEAVDYYLQHAARVREAVTVPELVKRFIDAKDDAGRSVRGLQTLRCALGSLARWLPTEGAATVTRERVEAWLRGSGWAAKTRNSRLGFASSCFAWGIVRGLCSRNPCVGISKAREHVDEIGTLTLDECKRLLKAALDETRWMPYVAIGLFCGCRRAELERLRWEQVNLKERTIVVTAKSVKTRQRRVVDVPDVAIAWLKAAGYKSTDAAQRIPTSGVAPSNLKDLWPAFRERAGLTRWPTNAMRHTFASMHYAHFQNEAALQVQMGHRSKDELFQHYRALKTREEARKFWALKP